MKARWLFPGIPLIAAIFVCLLFTRRFIFGVNGIVTCHDHQRNILSPVSAVEFLQFPSPSKLLNIESDAADALLEHFGDDILDVDKALEVYMKVSSVVRDEDDKTKLVACECTDAILTKLFSTNDESVPSQVANGLLVHLGLLKSEDKKFRPPSSIGGSLLVLEHSVQQDYFPKIVRDILQVFIGRPHPLLEASSANRQKLLTALFKF